MSDRDHEESTEKDSNEPSGTTLTLEEWFEELNKCDRLHQYAKKRKREESGEERREEPTEGTTLSTKEWVETLNKHDSFDQYAKKRRKKSSERC